LLRGGAAHPTQRGAAGGALGNVVGCAAAGAVAALVLIRSSRDVRQVVPVGELVPEAA